MSYIDLHTHSIFSDGRRDVATLLQRAQSEGLSVFSVSDHNKVGAYAEIKKHREMFSGKIIPAVELSAAYKGEVIEMLGYGIDTDKMSRMLYDIFPPVTAEEIIRHDVLALAECGAVMDKAFVKTMSESPWDILIKGKDIARAFWLEEMKRHPENARFFKSEEEFLNMTEGPFARLYLFNPSSPLYIDATYLFHEYGEIAEAIHLCGGLAFLAHPFIFSKNVTDNLEEFTCLDGMECHYGTFTKEQKRFACDFCDAHGLYKSGGSDYHGEDMRPQNVFARSCGERIELSLITDWIDKVDCI